MGIIMHVIYAREMLRKDVRGLVKKDLSESDALLGF